MWQRVSIDPTWDGGEAFYWTWVIEIGVPGWYQERMNLIKAFFTCTINKGGTWWNTAPEQLLVFFLSLYYLFLFFFHKMEKSSCSCTVPR